MVRYAPAAERNPDEVPSTSRPRHHPTRRRRRQIPDGNNSPGDVKEKPQEGEVIAAGPGSREEGGKLFPLDVKTNGVTLLGKWPGAEVKMDGEDLANRKEAEIMSIVEKM